MTSSHRATGTASVRQVSSPTPSGSWAPDELAAPDVELPIAAARPEPAPVRIDPNEQARLLDEGYARGLADGERKAAAAAQAKVAESVDVLTKVVGQMREVASLAPAVLEENIAALAVIVARQIVAREVSLDRELVADLVRRALTEFPVDQSVRIRVHPLDLALLTLSADGAGMAPITNNRDASWLADPRVARGGCLVEGRDRIVDGRVDTALERAYRRMSNIDAS